MEDRVELLGIDPDRPAVRFGIHGPEDPEFVAIHAEIQHPQQVQQAAAAHNQVLG